MDASQARIKELETKILSLQNEKLKQEQDNATVIAKYNDLKVKSKDYELDYKQAHDKLVAMEKSYDAKVEEIKRMEAALSNSSEMEVKMKKLQSSVNAYEKDVMALNSKCVDQSTKYATLQGENQVLMVKLQDLEKSSIAAKEKHTEEIEALEVYLCALIPYDQ